MIRALKAIRRFLCWLGLHEDYELGEGARVYTRCSVCGRIGPPLQL